jgi:hypothetical protein
MRNGKTKVQHLGYRVEVNRTGETGRDRWQRVGDATYRSKYLASQYLRDFMSRFPDTKKARIVGVRINVEPLSAGRDESMGAPTRAQMQAQHLASQKRRAA